MDIKGELMTKNSPIEIVPNFFPNILCFKDMKSAEKMACSFNSAPGNNF
jgi:hypothetical protein